MGFPAVAPAATATAYLGNKALKEASDASSSAAAEPGGDHLRIAYLIDVFPRPSNAFIVEQMAGVLAKGHQVDIYARSLLRSGLHHPALRDLLAPERLKHIVIPPGRLARLAKLIRLLAAKSNRTPAMTRELLIEPFAAGKLSRLYTALSFQQSAPYDVVHVQFATVAPLAVSLRRRGVLRGAIVTSFRGADTTRALREDPGRYDDLFRDGDLFLPVSESLRKLLLDAGCPAARTVVHHSGIDLSLFTFRERHREPAEATRCLFVGRLTEKKGLRFALEALAAVRKQGRDVVLDVAGDGEDQLALERLNRDLGLTQSVRFLGPLTPSEVRSAMDAAHVLVAPSVTASDGDQEGIPNVLKEAMASGMPVLTTTHSGIPELVEDGVSGMLAAEGDAAALARAWSVLAEHPERWAAMGRAGRAAVESGFSAARLTDDLVDLYRSVIRTPQAAPNISRR